MSASKVLFLDIDNTLLTHSKEITDENRMAIGEALAAGHRIVIASGRPHFAVLGTAKALRLDGPGFFLISYNGGQIWDCEKGKAIYRNPVSLRDVRISFEEADARGIHCQTYDSQSLLVRTYNKEAQYYVEHIHCPYRLVPELPDGLTEEPLKTFFISFEGREYLDPIKEAVMRRTEGRLSLFMSNEYYMECVPAGVSKGFALRFLCDRLGIPVDRSVAAGDSDNDVPMLEAAGIGCAMANGTDVCKASADYITEADCDHSGVAEIIRKFLL